jgi:hypothetical protein
MVFAENDGDIAVAIINKDDASITIMSARRPDPTMVPAPVASQGHGGSFC